MFVLSQIKEKRIKQFKYLCEGFTEVELTPEFKEILMDLTDIGDFMALNSYIRKEKQYMTPNFESIQIPLEVFFSMSLTDRENHLNKSKKCKQKSYYSFSCQHDYFENLLMKFIDDKRKSQCHSGFSFGYCLKNLVPFIIGDDQDKQNLWRKLIRSYLIREEPGNYY